MIQPLSSVCEIIMGQAPAGDTYNDDRVGLPLIAGASDFGEITPEPSRFTSAAAKVSRPNDIILCVRATIGDLNWSDGEYCLGRGVAGLRVNERKADRNYVWRALEHGAARLSSLGRGATFKQISKPDIANFEIPLPAIDEQKRIAVILDQADELRRKRQRAIDRLNQLGQAIFHEMFGDIGSLARTHTFEDVATIQKSLVDPKLAEHRSKLHVGPEHIASGVGIVAWENVRTAEEDKVISGKNWFKSGDIIYSKIRPYLNKVAIADRDGLCSADMYVIQPVNGKSNAAFLRMLLMGRDFLAYAETCSNRANIPKLNRKQVESYSFHCPSLQAQKEFAERVAEIEKIAAPFAAAAKSASDLFASLQHRAFQGEL